VDLTPQEQDEVFQQCAAESLGRGRRGDAIRFISFINDLEKLEELTERAARNPQERDTLFEGYAKIFLSKGHMDRAIQVISFIRDPKIFSRLEKNIGLSQRQIEELAIRLINERRMADAGRVISLINHPEILKGMLDRIGRLGQLDQCYQELAIQLAKRGRLREANRATALIKDPEIRSNCQVRVIDLRIASLPSIARPSSNDR
jgi:hypothetical protein